MYRITTISADFDRSSTFIPFCSVNCAVGNFDCGRDKNRNELRGRSRRWEGAAGGAKERTASPAYFQIG